MAFCKLMIGSPRRQHLGSVVRLLVSMVCILGVAVEPALAQEIQLVRDTETERLLIIEQPAELKVAHKNAVRWEAVEEIPGQVAITPSELLAAALRHRPDRIIMGEIRNECGYDLLQAMNTGHGGTLSTIHAKSAWDALNRLSNLALSARPNLNHAFMRSETAEAIDFVLYCERDHTGRRRVRELITVSGYTHADKSFQTEEVYRAAAA